MKFLPQSYKIFKMNSYFSRLLYGFTGFILLSLLFVGATSYISSSKRLLEEVKNSNLILLKQARDSIDKEIAQVDDISIKIAVDERVGRAVHLSAGDTVSSADLYNDISGYLNIIKTTGRLSSNTWNISSNVWIRFNKSKVIVNSDNKYDEAYFFNEVCVYKSYENWDKIFNEYSAFSTLGRKEIYYNFARSPVVTFTRSIPIGDIQPLGTITFNIDEKVFSSVINGISLNNHVVFYIVDSNNNVVFCNDKQYRYDGSDSLMDGTLNKYGLLKNAKEGELDGNVNGTDYTIKYISSKVNDWKYIAFIPTQTITSKVDSIRNITIIAIIISLLVGIIFSYLLVKKIYNPINDIVNYLNIINTNKRLGKGNEKGNDEFSFINNIINYVYKENENLKESFNRSLPMLKEKLLSDLLDGKITDMKLKEICENIGLEIPLNTFQVIVFEIDDYSSIGKNLRTDINEGIIECIDSIACGVFSNNARVYSIKKAMDKVVSIVSVDDKTHDTGSSYEFFNQVMAYYSQNFGVTFTIGVGKPYDSPKMCSMSFIEALYALKYKVVKGQNTIIHIDEVSNIPQNTFEYPVETEKHLVNKLKSGDMESVKAVLEDMFSANLNKNNPSPEMINNFFNALIGTAVRTVYEIQSTVENIFKTEGDLYNTISNKNTILEKKNYIISLFETIASFVNQRKSSHNLKVYEKVKKYVEDKYSTEVSLDSASEAVGLSPSYLSLVFKEVSGMNFVEYVNTFRIAKSKILLENTALTVSEISEKVGYSNSNTFIKVFKKYEGITPGQQRETYGKMA